MTPSLPLSQAKLTMTTKMLEIPVSPENLKQKHILLKHTNLVFIHFEKG